MYTLSGVMVLGLLPGMTMPHHFPLFFFPKVNYNRSQYENPCPYTRFHPHRERRRL